MAFQETEKPQGVASQPESKPCPEEQYSAEKPLEEACPDLEAEKEALDTITYPEGGARAYLVVLGSAGLLFCTMGYINAFG